MFVKYYTHIERPFPELEPSFKARSFPLHEWAESAYRDAERLTARVGVGSSDAALLAKTVEFQLEDLQVTVDKVTLALTWTATGPTALFPKMEADLAIEPLGSDLTQLSFQGSYTPPFGAAGLLLDKWALHRVAEASVKNLVDRVAKALLESEQPE